MKFSIIVPTCNRPQVLNICLDLIQKAMLNLKAEAELIVSDDSTDELTERLIKDHYPKIIYTKGQRKGPAANRNNGFSKSTNEWLVFIDDDCLPDANILSAYKEAIDKSPGILAFEGKIDLERPQERFNESAPINTHGGYFWTCNVVIHRNLFLELGCFDERLGMSMEDIAFRETLLKNKHTFTFVPHAVVIHPWKRESVKWILKDSINKYHSTLMYKKFYPEISANITGKHYIKSVAYRLFYSTKKLIHYRARGLHVLLVKSAIDIYHGLKLSRDLKK